MDRLDELMIFLRIIEEGSLSRAARRLRKSPPAVTRALASLERRVGSRLIDRTTRRLAATEAGRTFAEQARLVVGGYEAALQAGKDRPIRGTLRVTAPVLFGRRHVAPVVMAFLDAFEDVEVELLLADRNVDLIDEAVDVALRIGPLADSSLLVRKVGEVRRVWVASPRYLAEHGSPLRPADLANHDVIAGMSLGRDWSFGREKNMRRLRGRLRVDDVETRLQAARAGRGIAHLLSYQVADDLAAGRLQRLLRPHEGRPLPVSLLSKSASPRAPKIEAFLDFAWRRLSRLSVVRPERP